MWQNYQYLKIAKIAPSASIVWYFLVGNGPLLVCWGLWNALGLLDIVNFIVWIISAITNRNPKHNMKHFAVSKLEPEQFLNASMFNMKCWLYYGNNPDLLKLSNYQTCPTSSHNHHSPHHQNLSFSQLWGRSLVSNQWRGDDSRIGGILSLIFFYFPTTSLHMRIVFVMIFSSFVYYFKAMQ